MVKNCFTNDLSSGSLLAFSRPKTSNWKSVKKSNDLLKSKSFKFVYDAVKRDMFEVHFEFGFNAPAVAMGCSAKDVCSQFLLFSCDK